VKKPEASYSCT